MRKRGGGSQPIDLTGGTPTDQIFYADETGKNDGIRFTAKEAWTATVTEVATKADAQIEWLKLSQYSGGAGDFSLKITLTENQTGISRKAEIRILCGGTTITIVVEQKSTSKPDQPEDPEKPEPNPTKPLIEKISFTNEDTSGGHYEFRYDDQKRVVSCRQHEYRENNTYPDSWDITITYSSDSKVLVSFDTDPYVCTLNNEGNIQSIQSKSSFESGYESDKIEIAYQDRYMVKEGTSSGYYSYTYSWVNGNLHTAKNDFNTTTFSYLPDRKNDLTNLDLNALQLPSSRITKDFELDILSMIGLCGKRSVNYTTTPVYDKLAYASNPNDDFTYDLVYTDSPIAYTFNDKDYPTHIVCKYNYKVYKVMKATNERTLESDNDCQTDFTITYK